MEDAAFTDEFCRFIQTDIPSVEVAELLLALHREPGKSLTAAEAVAALGPDATLSAAEAARLMDRFRAQGLYQPLAPERRLHLELLDAAYRERPVTLVRIIYALRDTKVQSFAEAFRLRRK